MAHFAEIDENNIVLRVIAVNNNELLDEENNEDESLGSVFCSTLFGGSWVQTSYNRSFRKNFAAIGFSYDLVRDAFIPPKPFESWVLNEASCKWEAPTPMPDDGNDYIWDENNLQWVSE